MATAVELDPILIKALGFFRSKSSDSSSKLKLLLDESIEISKRPQDANNLVEKSTFLTKSGKGGIKSTKSSGIEQRKRDKDLAQKRQYDKIQRDLEEMNQDNAKKIHIDTLSPFSGSSSSSGSRTSSKHNSPAHDLVQTNGGFGKSSPLATTDNFELDMDDLACAVCKEMTVGSGNQLIECQECHNLYHQDCHQPPVNDKEVNDPRCIWYCARCKKSMRKQEKNFIQSSHPAHTLASPVDLFRDKNDAKYKAHSITPFKRTELKQPSMTTANNGGGSMLGWAALSGKSLPGKPLPAPQKEEVAKCAEVKAETLKLAGSKEKVKGQKGHPKNPKYGMTSDAWAEALGAKSSEKPKTSSNKTNSKHIALSSAHWLAGGTNNPKQKSPNSGAHKAAPFPKASAATPKSNSTHDGASKQVQMMKKKASAKMQQKRTKV